jgi:DNA-binding SARP family transcriptional activator
MYPTLHIRLLGEFNLNYDGTPLTTISTPRLQSLLTYLILHRNAPQARSHVAFCLWPDLSEARARANLRRQLHQLQHALPHADQFLSVEVNTIQWQTHSSFSLDVAEFEDAVSHAHSRMELQYAVELYGGDLVPGCYDDWIASERERLKQILIEVLERLLQLGTEEHDYRAAIGSAQRLLQIDPVREEVYRRLINLHTLNDDRAAALRAYHTCVSMLRRELGVEPGPATREAYERVLNIETSVGVSFGATFPLVGRDREWAQLQSAWRFASVGHPQMAVLIGEGGIGKTRLADELFTYVKRQGIHAAIAHCYSAEGTLAYAPVVAWLRARALPRLEPIWLIEIARLLPEVLTQHPDLPSPGPLIETWQRQRLHEALARAILGTGGPMLLWIEDLQWCDHDTLEWLHYLLRFDEQARSLVLGTLRPEEALNDHPLAVLLAALHHDRRLIEIEVAPLDAIGTGQLAAYVTGHDQRSVDVDCLQRETEGNPLFIVETLRAGLDCADAAPLSATLPPTMQTVITARLAQLSPQARTLIELAAIIGREFTFDVLQQASGDDEEILVRGLDELWQRRIVREIGTNAYDFSHGKLRDVAYASLSAARRRLLHRRVAEALVSLHADELDSVCAQVAAHYQQAGLIDQAVVYYRRAAEAARQVYANQAAITYLNNAIKLISKTACVERYDLLLAREKVYAIQSEREAQADDLAVLQELATALGDPIKQAKVAIEQGNYWRDISDFLAAIAAAQAALTWIGKFRLRADCAVRCADAPQPIADLTRLEIEAHYLWGMTLDFQGKYEDACIQHGQALALARASGLRRDEARCLYGLGRSTADLSGSEAYLKESLPIYREVGDSAGESLCLDQLAYNLSIMGDYEAAAAYYEQSLHLARQIGFRQCEVNVLFRLGMLHNQIGDYAGGRPYLEQAVAMARKDLDQRSVAQNLYNLSWNDRSLGQPEAARDHAQEALAICQAIGDRNGEAAAWKVLGEALMDLEQSVEAVVAFRQMLDLCQRLVDQSGTIDALARLAQAVMVRGDIVQAQSYVEEILRYDERTYNFQDTYVDAFPAYLACYHVLQANQDLRARRVLETAYTLLQRQAARITTETMRRSFLENVAVHRALVQAWNGIA